MTQIGRSRTYAHRLEEDWSLSPASEFEEIKPLRKETQTSSATGLPYMIHASETRSGWLVSVAGRGWSHSENEWRGEM